jgi:hypothetical protein
LNNMALLYLHFTLLSFSASPQLPDLVRRVPCGTRRVLLRPVPDANGNVRCAGGQKARLALARAAYARPDVALLDDPLSAVDPRVGRVLFQQCIGPAGLLQGTPKENPPTLLLLRSHAPGAGPGVTGLQAAQQDAFWT